MRRRADPDHPGLTRSDSFSRPFQSTLERVSGAPVREPGRLVFVFSIDRHAELR